MIFFLSSSSDLSQDQSKKKKVRQSVSPLKPSTVDLTVLSDDSDSDSSFTASFLKSFRKSDKKTSSSVAPVVPTPIAITADDEKTSEKRKPSLLSSWLLPGESVSVSSANNIRNLVIPQHPKPKPTLPSSSDRLWVDKYAPVNVESLAVHAKKITQVRQWLEDSFAGLRNNTRTAQRVLFLTGPPGSGKTATVQVLARELKIEVVEWLNPVNLKDFGVDGVKMTSPNQMSHFEDFLKQVQRYPSLMMEGNDQVVQNKLILVEDMPFMVDDRDQIDRFRNALRKFFANTKFPLVFILCDSAEGTSSLDVILGDLRANRLGYEQIAFNPTNMTLVTKVLKNVAQAEGFAFDDEKEVMKRIWEECNGDLRASINKLQMICVGIVGEEEVVKTKKAKKRKVATYSDLGNRDTSLSIFHGLGKVFHPKRDEVTGNLMTPPEDIAERMTIGTGLLSLFLHENYLNFFTRVEDCIEAMDVLCDVDEMMTHGGMHYSVETAAASLAVRGLTQSHFVLAANRFTPFYRAKARDYDQIRQSTHDTARSLFLHRWGNNLDDGKSFSSTLSDMRMDSFLLETLPLLGMMTLQRRVESSSSPQNDLRMLLGTGAMQFLYTLCSFDEHRPNAVVNVGDGSNMLDDDNEQQNDEQDKKSKKKKSHVGGRVQSDHRKMLEIAAMESDAPNQAIGGDEEDPIVD